LTILLVMDIIIICRLYHRIACNNIITCITHTSSFASSLVIT
jgi:hypothetical protein